MTAVSLNVGRGICIIKPAKLYMCMQTHSKHDEDGHTAPGVHGHGSLMLSHSGNDENWITQTSAPPKILRMVCFFLEN